VDGCRRCLPYHQRGGATRASISAGGTKRTDCVSRSSAGSRRGRKSDSILAGRTDELRRIRSCKALTWTDIALRESSRLGSPSKASAVRQERRGVRCRTGMAVGANQATPRVHMTDERAKRKPDRVCPAAVDDNPSPACAFIIPWPRQTRPALALGGNSCKVCDAIVAGWCLSMRCNERRV
jgi:hypothetical protein